MDRRAILSPSATVTNHLLWEKGLNVEARLSTSFLHTWSPPPPGGLLDPRLTFLEVGPPPSDSGPTSRHSLEFAKCGPGGNSSPICSPQKGIKLLSLSCIHDRPPGVLSNSSSTNQFGIQSWRSGLPTSASSSFHFSVQYLRHLRSFPIPNLSSSLDSKASVGLIPPTMPP